MANLRLIRDLAHLRSVSKAARLSEISQSAASQTLADLERELGVMLFDRSTRPITTTLAGKLYSEFCREVLRRHEELQAGLDLLRKKSNGVARLAAIYSVGLSEMSQIETRFQHLFPEAELQISYLRPERVWQAVELDEADLGLMSYADSSRDVIALPWREEEMVVATAPHHPLAQRRAVNAKELEGEQFVGFDDDLPIQGQIERYLRDHKVVVDMALHFDNLQMIKEAVAHGSGISILPKRVLRQDVQSKRIVVVQLEPAELYRPLHIIHRRRKSLNEVTRGLLTLLKEEEQPAAGF